MTMPFGTDIDSPPVIIIEGGNRGGYFNGVYEAANELGWRMLDLRITSNSLVSGLNIIGLFTNANLNGSMVKEFMAKGVHVIRVGSLVNPKEDSNLPAVLPNMQSAGHMAADLFADKRFEHVGFVANYPFAETPYLYNAFRDRAKERECKCHLLQLKTLQPEDQHPGEQRFKYRMNQVKTWLQSLPKPVGVFTYNDMNAAGLYTAAREVGLEVPEDVAFLGLGNTVEVCEFLPVPLSSIDLNFEETGRRAVKLLKALVDGMENPDAPVMVEPLKVVDRQSTNLLAVQDPVVARGLRFIWDHFTEQISVNDVAAAVGVARSTITRKFRTCLNHSVIFELRRKRLERSCELLRSTRMPIADVAKYSGFPSPPYFHMAFKELYGMTPSEYKKHK